MKTPKISVIIINYNYSHYIEECILSCINQTYDNKEIIVVDDGSTDDSKNIIEGFHDNVKAVFQENCGMVAASNNGFKIASGDIIIFLDSDDYLFKNAFMEIVRLWNPSISKVHYRLEKRNSSGERIGYAPPINQELPSGEVLNSIIEQGNYITTPTSGNAFSRMALSKIFPINEAIIGDGKSYFRRIPTDAFLKRRVVFFGEVKAINEPLGVYRIHGKNKGAGTSPYLNRNKRQRILYQIKNDKDFIKKNLKEKGINNWDEDVVFRKDTLLRLRLISLRLDKGYHLWKNDNRNRLILLKFKNIINTNIFKAPKVLYELLVISIIAFLPKIILRATIKIYKQ